MFEPRATVITDGWAGYSGLEKLGYVHDRRSQRAARACGEDPGALLPAVHRVVSLAKRWLLGTHQGSVEPAHLASYLNEFVFRFNRRLSLLRLDGDPKSRIIPKPNRYSKRGDVGGTACSRHPFGMASGPNFESCRTLCGRIETRRIDSTRPSTVSVAAMHHVALNLST